MVVTILQQRQSYHMAMIAQTVTPENIPLQQAMAQLQQWASTLGASALEAQALGLRMLFGQVAQMATVMAFDDVFRVTAAFTLLALIPAAFMDVKKQTGGPRPGPIME